jgi:hypothetical protein
MHKTVKTRKKANGKLAPTDISVSLATNNHKDQFLIFKTNLAMAAVSPVLSVMITEISALKVKSVSISTQSTVIRSPMMRVLAFRATMPQAVNQT